MIERTIEPVIRDRDPETRVYSHAENLWVRDSGIKCRERKGQCKIAPAIG